MTLFDFVWFVKLVYGRGEVKGEGKERKGKEGKEGKERKGKKKKGKKRKRELNTYIRGKIGLEAK